MNNKFHLKTLSILFILLAQFSFAQISEGGLPASFQHNLKNDIATENLPAVSEQWKKDKQVKADKNGTLQAIGKIIETNYTFHNSGTWHTAEKGNKIWRLKINAEKAQGVNLYFKNFELPQGAKMFVYNEEKTQVLGAFTAKNNSEMKYFATEIIYGSHLIVEYFVPNNAKNLGTFTIEGVNSIYTSLKSGNNNLKSSGSCQVNVNCSEGNSWRNQQRGVARILMRRGGGTYLCSGSLVNNTAQDGRPYFLTAYHCDGGSTSLSDFQQWVFNFNYESSNCSGTTTSTTQSITGAQVRASSNSSGTSSSDFLLLELNQNVPASYNPYFNGWDKRNIPATSGVGIHHPSGDIKKISTYTSTLISSGYNGNGLSSHWRVTWSTTANGNGVTEGGSSGSPIFNQNGLIVGSLTGGLSCCTVGGCNNNPYTGPTKSDSYGKMSYHWQFGTANNRRLDVWLDPTNSGATTLNGTSQPNSSPSLDAELVSIVSPTAENCSFNIRPTIQVKNNGTINITSLAVDYQINGGTTVSGTWSGNLAPNNTMNLSLTASNVNTANNSININITAVNNTTDNNPANNSKSLSFVAGVTQNLPLFENFEKNTYKVSVFNPDDSITWQIANVGAYGQSNHSYYIDNWDYGRAGEHDRLSTKSYNFINRPNDSLTFDMAYAYYQGSNGTINNDSLGIAYSLDCGQNYQWLWKKGGAQLATAGGLSTEFTPSANQWRKEVIDLSQFNNETSVEFAFIGICGYGNNLYIDNINIGDQAINIQNINHITTLNIFPNPTENQINVKVELAKAENITLSISNVLGEEIIQESFEKQSSLKQNFDVSQWAKGIYFIKVKTAKGQQIQKFVIQ